MNKTLVRFILPVVALSVIYGTAVPAHTHAQAPVIEVGPALVTQKLTLVETGISAIKNAAQVTKDWILDDLAYQVANLAIQSMTKSIVNWINSGFDGSPAFVTDLNTNLRGVADTVAARFFEELSSQDIATTPFQDKVLDSVRLAYYLRTSPESFYTRNPYTLDQVSPDSRAFLAGDFSQGGFNALFSAVMNPSNNPYGAQMLANRALEDAVAGATGNRLEELQWNSGFLSWRGECEEMSEPGVESLAANEKCLSYEIKTPGSVIMESLNKVEGVPFDRLVAADEFNEILGALLNQLALQLIGGGDGGGVRGVSQPSSGGGTPFINQTSGGTSGQTGVGGTPDVSTAATARAYRQSVDLHLGTVGFYANSWRNVATAASAAVAQCGAQGGAQEVLDQANGIITTAEGYSRALAAINADLAAISAAEGDQSLAFLEIDSRISAILNSDGWPNPARVTDSYRETSGGPGSVIERMNQLVANNCSVSSE